MTVVIFGINALEANIVEQSEFDNLLLADRGRLKIPEHLPLHTEVLWPSIITGVGPDIHGLTRTTARQWENPLLEVAADVGTSIVPEQYLLPIGKRIQKLGFERESKSGEAYFESRGIETIFSGVDSVEIDIPGYSDREDTDKVRKLMGHDEYEPRDEELFLDAIEEEFQAKRGALLEALDEDATLYACYFQSLDNVQHVYWTDQSMMDEWYGRFDEFINTIRDRLSAEDELIVMSDHGMQRGSGGKGDHSDHGYYASTTHISMDNILDLKSAVDDLLGPDRGSKGLNGPATRE